MEVVATAKWVRMTARKARLVTDSVQGMAVADALTVLTYTPRAAATEVAKVIKSAAANAEHNYNLDTSALRIARIEVEDAAIIKRFRAKPRGMAGSIFKRTSHLRAFVSDDLQPPANRRRGTVTTASASKASEPAAPVKKVTSKAGTSKTGSSEDTQITRPRKNSATPRDTTTGDLEMASAVTEPSTKATTRKSKSAPAIDKAKKRSGSDASAAETAAGNEAE